MFRNLGFVLIALFLARLLTINAVPLLEPSEGRYAVVAKEMHETGDWVTPRLWHEGESVPFLGKPPLHFWFSSTVFSALGSTTAAARVPSFLAAILLLATLFFVVRLRFDRATALRASVITAACPFFFALSAAVLLDMTLAACVDGALLCYFAYLTAPPESRASWSRAVFAFLGLGMLAKGPVSLVMAGLAVGGWSLATRRFRHLRDHAWLSGLAIFLAICLPWYLMAEQAKPGFLRYFLINENFLRYFVHDYGDRYGSGHEFPFGSAILFFLAGVLPWLFMLIRRRKNEAAEPCENRALAGSFFLAGTLSNLAFLSFAHQLLWTYVLPVIPLAGVWLATRGWVGSQQTVARVGWALAASYLVLYFAAAPWLEKRRSPKKAVAETLHILDGDPGQFTFLRKIPYGGTFLADVRLWQHEPKEWRAHLDKFLALGGRRLVLVSPKERRYLPELPLRRVREIDTWLLCEPTESSPIAAK